jgi:hypothetical protein
MKIIINNNNNSDSRESAIVEINTKHCHYPYSIRESLELALKLDGYSQETISKVFNQENEDAKKIVSEEFQAKLDHYFPELATSRTITKTNECLVSKKKQSSIESIKEKLKIYLPDTLWDNDYLQDMLQRHEAKHKVEIMNAWHDAGGECSNSEIYYSETFGGGKDE